MRKVQHVTRRPVAAAVLTAAVLGTTAACAASGTSAPSGATATATATASASASVNPLAGLTADQIASRATADLKVVASVHVAGSGTDSGQTVGMDLTLGTRGCTGTLSVKGEGSFALLRIGSTVWIKPDAKFWKYAMGSNANATVMQIIEGKWIKPAGKGSGLGALGDICNPAKFASSIGDKLTGLVKDGTTTIDGQPALKIKDATDPDSGYVTISDHPEFLRLDAGSDGVLNFSGYNAPMNLTPPPASEVLDGAKYGF